MINRRPRIIPCLTMINRGLYKTTNFGKPRYLGDPINTLRLFNNKEVDEICILSIGNSTENKEPDYVFLKEIANEAFMPLSYGGGIKSLNQMVKLFKIGFEKIIINTAYYENPNLVRDACCEFGSQSVVVSIDVKTDLLGRKSCFVKGSTIKIKTSPLDYAKKAEELGAGEILLQSIDRDGTMKGYDIDLIKTLSKSVSIPVIACGGAKDINDLKQALVLGQADAVAASSMFVYYGKQKAVLVSYPSEEEILSLL